MVSAPLPLNEQARVRTLHGLGLLDTPPEERFERIVRLAVSIFNVPMAAINFVDSDRQWAKAIYGFSPRQVPRAYSFCAHVLHQPGLLEVQDAAADQRFWNNPLVLGQPSIRFYAGHPLFAPDKLCLGTLCIMSSQPRALTGKERDMLELLAAMVSREIELTPMHQEHQDLRLHLEAAQHQTRVDPLTQLWNRQSMIEALAAELQHADQHKRPLAVLMLLVDQFKAINESYGHLTGELVLQKVSRGLHASVRPPDRLGRYGGEEFLVILPGHNAEQAQQRAEQMRRHIEASPIELASRSLALTTSIGVAAVERPTSTMGNTLLLAAERALLQAKEQGRNRVIVADL